MKQLVWILAIALFVLHQDFWLWNNDSLVFGFLPAGLAYHAGFSIAAAVVWALAVKFAWPHQFEKWADEFDGIDPEAAKHNEGESK